MPDALEFILYLAAFVCFLLAAFMLPPAAAGQRVLLALVGHEAGKVLTSQDGGHAWTSAATGLEGRYPAVRGLAFADPRAGWAVTGRGTSLENGCTPATPAATTTASSWPPPTAAPPGRTPPLRLSRSRPRD